MVFTYDGAAVPKTISLLWSSVTQDLSSNRTGSSVFDFQGDGAAEVVYGDECFFRIYSGKDGAVLFQTPSSSATIHEYPVVVDVDADNQTEVLVVSNDFTAPSCPLYGPNDKARHGLFVYGDANNTWVRTRRIWNQHPYHVTNVNEDGTIPAHEQPNWTQPGLNNFRQNKQPGSEFSAPDAVVSLGRVCPGPSALVATVRNVGQAALPSGVAVGFYLGQPGSGTLLGQGTTKSVLYPAEAEEVTLALVNPDPGLLSGATPVYAVVDDGMPAHPLWHECRADNNTSSAMSAKCDSPQ
jgi:hypothetical protein